MLVGMRVPVVVFDLDGTLVDSEPLYYEAGRRMLAAHGVAGFGWADHVPFIGVSTEETLATLRERYGLGAPVAELVAEFDGIYLESARASAAAFPRMRDLVEGLRAAGNRLAVASGSSREVIDAVLAGTGLSAHFETTVSAQEVPRGKPAPDVFFEAARRLGVSAGRCVVVEDAPAGVLAAAKAGMRCLAVPSLPEWADDPAFAQAALVVAGGQPALDPAATLAWING
jgi:HAD superfamily hydrolase (TIGR01509 family)